MEGWDWRWFWDWTTNILSSIIEPKYHSIMRWAKMAWRSLLLPNTILLNIIITFSPIVIQRKKNKNRRSTPCFIRLAVYWKWLPNLRDKISAEVAPISFLLPQKRFLVIIPLIQSTLSFLHLKKKKPKAYISLISQLYTLLRLYIV